MSTRSREICHNMVDPTFCLFHRSHFSSVNKQRTWCCVSCLFLVEESNSAPAIAGATSQGSGAALNAGSRFLTIPGNPGKPLFCARFFYSHNRTPSHASSSLINSRSQISCVVTRIGATLLTLLARSVRCKLWILIVGLEVGFSRTERLSTNSVFVWVKN